MKPNKTKGPKAGHLPSAVELILHKLAQEADVRSPQSDEDIVEMLNSQDLSNVPKPDPGRFERLIQQRRPPKPPIAVGPTGPPPLVVTFSEFRRRLQRGKAGYFTGTQVDRLISGVTYEGEKLQPQDLPVGWRFSRLNEAANACLPLEKVYKCLVNAGKIQSPTGNPTPPKVVGPVVPELIVKVERGVAPEPMVNVWEGFWDYKVGRN
jgi:hypothetical protein